METMNVNKIGLSTMEIDSLLQRKLNIDHLYLDNGSEMRRIVEITMMKSIGDLFILVEDACSGTKAVIGHPYGCSLETRDEKSILRVY